ncbi:MAG: AhpC/TSA family protein [Coleofasciculaceae cyanobacterium SM2_3_26]|nr:AhpC/TSA family protein [Coleofasciculaceae cyanobacterium SM2_3_26]
MAPIKPIVGMSAPWLEVSTLAGSTWRLADRKPQNFTAIVFYRGLHCPLCKNQLNELESKLGEFEKLGVEVIAISGDTHERAQKAKDDWGLQNLSIGYGNSMTAMQRWGLYVSRGAYDNEPPFFNEPALFLVRPDGILHYAVINSGPFGRPYIEDMIGGIDYIMTNNYPVRGTEFF